MFTFPGLRMVSCSRMQRRFAAFCLVFGAISFVAAGCRKAPTETVPRTGGNSQGTNVEERRPPTEEELRQELRDVLQNFKQSKSFRATVTSGTPGGQIVAKLQIAKPGRFQGMIDTGKGTPFEVIVIDTSMYMRLVGSGWINLSKTSSAKTIAEALREILNVQGNLDVFGVDEAVSITRYPLPAKNCDMYETKLKNAEGVSQESEICVRDGRPASLEIKTAEGPVRIDYYDYNAVFLIERPVR